MRKVTPVLVALFVSATVFGQDAATAPIPQDIKDHHKTHYARYFADSKKNIDQETRAGRDFNQDITIYVDRAAMPEAVNDPHAYPNWYLRSCACSADAIVVAVPKTAEVGLTDDGNGLFTDSRFLVESVLKNTTATALESSSTIIVTRPGGDTTMHGHKVHAGIGDFPQFVIGQRYLLFLGYLAKSNTFEAFSVGSYELKNGSAVPLYNMIYGANAVASPKENAFLTETSAAIAASCAHTDLYYLGKQEEQ